MDGSADIKCPKLSQGSTMNGQVVRGRADAVCLRKRLRWRRAGDPDSRNRTFQRRNLVGKACQVPSRIVSPPQVRDLKAIARKRPGTKASQILLTTWPWPAPFLVAYRRVAHIVEPAIDGEGESS